MNTRVEDACDSDVHVILTMESVCQGLSYAFSLIVASPRPNGIDMPPTEDDVRKRCCMTMDTH